MSSDTGRRTIMDRLRARPLLAASVAAAAVALIAFVLVWFQPQALLFDRVVDEALPGADPAAAGTERAVDPDATEPEPQTTAGDDTDGSEMTEPDDEVAAPAGPVVLSTGSFESRNRYTVVGEATVFELEDGARVLRLEEFESTNGPDLYVYLTAADHADPDSALADDVVDLGVLKGNIGNQNYDLPADVDLDRYDTVVIWCLRFTTSFGAADLSPA